ncbi:unnamed protein product [Mytilus edulis]|uniref:SAM domain-containing protein n=1 Tax=Mytilus edulis TaxID=6550 RepID=A0A8S3R7Q6_MYTED|nr:unnamed protein product [Mytilus edulis]
MKASDSTLHVYLNDIDQGKVVSNLPEADTTTEAGAQVAIKKTQNFSLRPADWNVQTVCDFIDSIPECAPYVEKFRSERINGAALLELDKKDLKDFFEMPLGLAVNVCSHLKKKKEVKMDTTKKSDDSSSEDIQSAELEMVRPSLSKEQSTENKPVEHSPTIAKTVEELRRLSNMKHNF